MSGEATPVSGGLADVKEQKRSKHESNDPPSKRFLRSSAPCQHSVAVPPDYVGPELATATHGTIHDPVWQGDMVKSYPFKLDSFQATAVACIERNESVLVAAHTSAGKTAVAEYAIAKALKSQQRVVYTSPLKALSNQKFRELSNEFTDVGLMTGDVSLNPNASCVVMTTEILRSMVYRGSELLREVAWVIFDEVHYMQDRERGVVWEEVIIFMPKAARMVFLSATLQNSVEFAEWIASVHGSPCHVVSTDYRPTPLVHYAFPLGGNGLYLLVDDQGRFKSDSFAKMKAAFGPSNTEGEDVIGTNKEVIKGKKRQKGSSQQGPPVEVELEKLIRVIKDKKLEPVIIFSFSRRECENYARMLIKKPEGDDKPSRSFAAKLDFNSAEEKESVQSIFDSAMQCLSPEDRNLPFIRTMLPMLQRGIGVHHSGLLPILKELVEILFQEQLIKCLFSTETFAMGLNMPAKTVIFTSIKKWDGEENRFISSGEYIQMSGRAGRRGKDDRGYAIMLADNTLEEGTCREMLKGSAAPLMSSFKLTYYTLLNLMRRVEGSDADMESVISRSFSQFQHDRRLPILQQKLASLQAEADAITTTGNCTVAEYLNLKQFEEKARATVMSALLQPDRCMHFLRAGRIVRVADGAQDYGYGVVVSMLRMDGQPGGAETAEAYVVDTLLRCEHGKNGRLVPSAFGKEQGEMVVIPVALSLLTMISTLRVSLPQDLKPAASRKAVEATLEGLISRYPRGHLPELDPIADFGIEDASIQKAATEMREVAAKLTKLATNGTNEETHGESLQLDAFRKKAQLLSEVESIKRQMHESQLTSFQNEAKCRVAVLRKLGHVDGAGIVTLKGRAASEIDTADELVASELMFNGTFGKLDKHQLAALVSCLVPVENSNAEVKLLGDLANALAHLHDAVQHIISVSNECKLEIDAETYLDSFKPSLMDAVNEWSKGATFAEVCNKTDIFEGSIIRALRRLVELLQNLQNAATVVGDSGLAALFKDSIETIKRDLPFAASLYI